MDLLGLSAAVGCNMVLAGACKDAGWSVTKLAGVYGADDEVLDGVFMGLEVLNPDKKFSRNDFDELLEAANTAAEAVWSVHGGVTDAELALASRLSKVQTKLDNLRRQKVDAVVRAAPRKGTAVRDTWPTRAGRRLAESPKVFSAIDQKGIRSEPCRSKFLKGTFFCIILHFLSFFIIFLSFFIIFYHFLSFFISFYHVLSFFIIFYHFLSFFAFFCIFLHFLHFFAFLSKIT